MKVQEDPKASLGRQPDGASTGIHVGKASVIIEPRDFRAWAAMQILTINWTNVALIVTVIAISTNINGQLNEQRVQYATAQDAIGNLRNQLTHADQLAMQLGAMQTQLLDFNRTLSYAISLGFGNLTNRLSALEAVPFGNLTNRLSVLEAVPFVHVVSDPTSGLGTSFQNGWSPYTGGSPTNPYAPAFTLKGGVVRLQGATTGGSVNTVMFTLPDGYRPVKGNRYFIVDTGYSGASSTQGNWRCAPRGRSLSETATTHSRCWTRYRFSHSKEALELLFLTRSGVYFSPLRIFLFMYKTHSFFSPASSIL